MSALAHCRRALKQSQSIDAACPAPAGMSSSRSVRRPAATRPRSSRWTSSGCTRGACAVAAVAVHCKRTPLIGVAMHSRRSCSCGLFVCLSTCSVRARLRRRALHGLYDVWRSFARQMGWTFETLEVDMLETGGCRNASGACPIQRGSLQRPTCSVECTTCGMHVHHAPYSRRYATYANAGGVGTLETGGWAHNPRGVCSVCPCRACAAPMRARRGSARQFCL